MIALKGAADALRLAAAQSGAFLDDAEVHDAIFPFCLADGRPRDDMATWEEVRVVCSYLKLDMLDLEPNRAKGGFFEPERGGGPELLEAIKEYSRGGRHILAGAVLDGENVAVVVTKTGLLVPVFGEDKRHAEFREEKRDVVFTHAAVITPR